MVVLPNETVKKIKLIIKRKRGGGRHAWAWLRPSHSISVSLRDESEAPDWERLISVFKAGL